MSVPISFCAVSKAAFGDAKAYDSLVEAMDYNTKCGHFSTFPCACKPPCPVPTAEQLAALDAKVMAAVLVRQKKALQPVIPTQCCGATLLLKCGTVYKCPCGKTEQKI